MGFLVRIEDTGQSFDVEPGETILAAALRQDTALPHDCTLGGCGACRIRLAEGAVEYDELPFGLSEAEAADGYALACKLIPEADLRLQVIGKMSRSFDAALGRFHFYGVAPPPCPLWR